MANYKWTNRTPSWVDTLSYNDYLDIGPEKYKDVYSGAIQGVVGYFKNYPGTGINISWSDFQKDPSGNEYSTVHLKQSDFDHGTVRLQHPAKYVLDEDIVFSPNQEDNFMPTQEQMDSGEYPAFPYSLGFFAAITVEGQNICLSLEGYTLRQSQIFNVQQRFYAHIELASTPFIPGQGPGKFGPTITAAKNCFIGNGHLGLSSHHGIHGNDMQLIQIQNLNMSEYEVAGIALNGGISCLVRNIQMCGLSKQVRVLSTYSTARFIVSFLNSLEKTASNPTLVVDGQTLTLSEIRDQLDVSMKEVTDAINTGGEIPDDSIYKNKTGLYDGGAYGLVLNARGAIVGAFRKSREGAIGNEDIVAHDISIADAHTGQAEVLGILCNNPKDPPQYGGCMQVGPAGAVFQVMEVKDSEGRYVGNPLSNAELILAKYKNEGLEFKSGTTNITPDIVQWAAENSQLDPILLAFDRYYVSGGDSMAHTMKGYIHVFLSGGKNLKLFNISMIDGGNESAPGVANEATTASDPGVRPIAEVFNGASSRGICVAACENTFIEHVEIDSLSARCGNSCAVDFIGECKGIRCRTGISVKRIVSSPQVRTGAPPNPPSRPLFFLISPESSDIQIK